MIPLKEKDEDWKKDTMDSLESIALAQRNSNISLIENYEMVKGKFVFSHYFGDEGYDSMLNQLSKEFSIPNYLKHYDIISPVVNTLLGEWSKRPDSFRVKDWSEKGTNEFKRQKKELLAKYVEDTINIEINKRLLDMGLTDIEPQSEEEAQQLQQQIEQVRQSMTPPEIEQYMKTDFSTAAEMWGNNRLKADKQRFNLDEKEKREFEDMLVADRCFRHFFLTANGYSQETWNPVNTFYHKSPDVEYIEDGDYVGRVFTMTLSDIIDRYGYLMTEEQLEKLTYDYKKTKTNWAEAKGYSYVYDEYMVPFQGYPGYQAANSTIGPFDKGESTIPFLDNTMLNNIQKDGIFTTGNGFYSITEAYWKSQETIGLLTYMDEETGLIIKKLVDEHYIKPKHIVESKNIFSDEQDVNTITYTKVNRIWKGIKINLGNREQSIYLDIKPLEFQFKGDLNVYGAKLPVCGQVFSIRNSRSMSLVDMMKPHQIGYNVAMNQLYQLCEKEVGSFLIFDVNMFPNAKDWGGEDSWGKWMTIAKSLNMLPIDTSPTNTQGAASAAGGQFPKILNLELGAQMMSRMNIAKFFEEQAMKQVGFNQYRLGQFASTSTATGIQQGDSQSQAQTETYFTNFSNYLRRTYRMNLDIAQYVDSKNKDINIAYVNNDLTTSFHATTGTDLLLSDLYIYVSNSQEQLRQLESLRQLGLQNNTTGATIADLAEIVTTNSPQQIVSILKESTAKMQEQQAQAQQAQQAQLEQQGQIAQMVEDKKDERLDKQLTNEKDIALINAQSKLFLNRSYEPSEQDINTVQNNLAQENVDIKREQLDHKKESTNQKMMDDRDIKIQKLALDNKKVDAMIQKEKDDLKYAKIMKGKE